MQRGKKEIKMSTSRGALAVPEATARMKTDDDFEAEFRVLHDEEIAHQGKLNHTIFAMGETLNNWQSHGLSERKLRELAGHYGYKVSTLLDRMRSAREIPAEHRNDTLSYGAHVEVLRISYPAEGTSTPEIEEVIDQARWDVLKSVKPEATVMQVRDAVARRRRKLAKDLNQQYGREILPIPRVTYRPLEPSDPDYDPDDQEDGGEDTRKDPHGRERGGDRFRNLAIKERMDRLSWAGGFLISDGISGIVEVKGTYQNGLVVLTTVNTADFADGKRPSLTVQQDSSNFVVSYALDLHALDEPETDDAVLPA
jgi:hypothetical protein